MIQDAIKMLQDFEQLRKVLHDEMREHEKTIGECDRTIGDMYHIIELVPLNAVQRAKVMSKLKKVLEVRREAKEARIMLNNCLSQGKKVYDESVNSEGRYTNYRNEAEAAYKKYFG